MFKDQITTIDGLYNLFTQPSINFRQSKYVLSSQNEWDLVCNQKIYGHTIEQVNDPFAISITYREHYLYRMKLYNLHQDDILWY
jgi:hypothetical protein